MSGAPLAAAAPKGSPRDGALGRQPIAPPEGADGRCLHWNALADGARALFRPRARGEQGPVPKHGARRRRRRRLASRLWAGRIRGRGPQEGLARRRRMAQGLDQTGAPSPGRSPRASRRTSRARTGARPPSSRGRPPRRRAHDVAHDAPARASSRLRAQATGTRSLVLPDESTSRALRSEQQVGDLGDQVGVASVPRFTATSSPKTSAERSARSSAAKCSRGTLGWVIR